VDGLVRATPATEPYLAAQRLQARPYSVTALQHFAACPYRFLLAAIHRLEPRQEAAALVQLDPLTRGRMFHHVQAEVLRALQSAGRIPAALERIEEAQFVLDETLDRLAAVYRDDLAPAIPRIWDDEMATMRSDLRLWLRALGSRCGEWRPRAVELAFGLGAAAAASRSGATSHGAGDRGAPLDPASPGAPVTLAGGWLLRGAVDLVEERLPDGALRVTDHKTGSDRTYDGLLVGGGEVLQPALYALAIEALQERPVVEGRLFFCTARGRFRERIVPLGEFTRKYAGEILQVVDGSISMGFLPPAPRAGACTFCDFRPVCGPHEEIRSRRKTEPSLDHLEYVRSMP
jgi:RecB family exonuclease